MSISRVPRLLVLLLALTAACGDRVSSDAEDGDSSDTGGDGDGDGDGDREPDLPAGECVDESIDCPNPDDPRDLACELGDPCGLVTLSEETFDSGDWLVDDPVAFECLVHALRDRSPGTYELLAPDLLGEQRWKIRVLADGVVDVFYDRIADFSCTATYDAFHPRPAAHFDGCLAESADPDKIDCLLDWAEDCALDTELACP